jgi:hypothetical protein
MNKTFNNSSQIASSEYDEETLSLTVTFTSGSKYKYDDVPKALVEKFYNLPENESPGKFFNVHVKGLFTCNKI